MFTEFEIAAMVEDKEIHDATFTLKKDFIKNEAPYLEISDHDFFSLIMMTPIVGIALANDNVSLFEELALNKKARKLSKGGYFMKKDPVVYAMSFILKREKYDLWEPKFLKVLQLAMDHSFDRPSLIDESKCTGEVEDAEYKKLVLATPYILIRFISSFFLENDEDIINDRSIAKDEYEKVVDLGKRLGIDKIPVFYMFCKTFDVKFGIHFK